MVMQDQNIEAVVVDWIKFYEFKVDNPAASSYWWAAEKVVEWTDPDWLWGFVLLAYKKEMSDFAFGNLAAGPLESLLARHGKNYIDRVEQLANADSKFNELLGGVWQNAMPDEI